ncbi:hypothetical protein [Labrys monachus]|uniref:Uncharacterized protein n=1 Tax=Labrys monachus TaxID=217067 RepID=A0ABU0FHE0_9HYPH|nr:hypothetical protein [Labrys monachus]MDQ0393539.1 hypothetical protein [Labrys monachus]
MTNARETTDPKHINLDAAAFFGLPKLKRIRSDTTIGLSDRSYLPKVDDPRSITSLPLRTARWKSAIAATNCQGNLT